MGVARREPKCVAAYLSHLTLAVFKDVLYKTHELCQVWWELQDVLNQQLKEHRRALEAIYGLSLRNCGRLFLIFF
jgi:hypothetical protein